MALLLCDGAVRGFPFREQDCAYLCIRVLSETKGEERLFHSRRAIETAC